MKAKAPKEITGKGGEIVLYTTKDGRAAVDVRLEQETIWLPQKEIAVLFDTERSVITKHFRNIFASGELDKESNVQKMHIAGSDKPVAFYNLDAILSVGYRVNSRRGTEFRIWATSVLRDHLLQGYTLNEKRLRAKVERLAELQAAIDLMGRLVAEKSLSGVETDGLLRVIADYSLALRLLDQYDHQHLRLHGTTEAGLFVLTCEAARAAIARMAEKTTGDLFGREIEKGLESAFGAVFQAFDGRDLYPSIEEKAAHLLYFVVKNHAFVDGNKRIGAFLFIWFLDSNGLLYRKDGTKRLADNALVALTLLIAESKPAEKDVLCKVVVNLINRQNL